MTASHFTPRLQLPYPDETDPADVPLDISNLANKLDTITGRNAGQALSAAPVLDVGQIGQVRAGRQLTLADFTALGLTAPAGLWNLSDLTDASGNGRALTNKGAVPFGVGINGQSSTAAVFAGATTQALYIADTGAADPFRIKTGSWGCWFRTAKRATSASLLAKRGGASGAWGWELYLGTGNQLTNWATVDGTTLVYATGVSDVADDRWHFGVVSADGSVMRLYVDGVLEATTSLAGAVFGSSGPLALGIEPSDLTMTAAGTSAHYGRVDEAFVTPDILSDDQVRALYCAKIAHGYAITPTAVTLNVRRRKRGGPLATTDFPTQPLRLHNFTAGSLADQGSGNIALTNNGTALSVAGADGAQGGAFSFNGSQSLSSTDAGLPSALATRSYGCWFKTTYTGGSGHPMGYGTSGESRLMVVVSTGILQCISGADVISGPYAADGQWHHAVVTEDNGAGDGVRRKLYVDGRLVAGSTVLNSLVLGGAGFFRVGLAPNGTSPLIGQVDGAFVCGYALTSDQVFALYAKGSQALGASPKEPGAHVEAMDATNVYATFDTLDSSHTIDLGVTG